MPNRGNLNRLPVRHLIEVRNEERIMANLPSAFHHCVLEFSQLLHELAELRLHAHEARKGDSPFDWEYAEKRLHAFDAICRNLLHEIEEPLERTKQPFQVGIFQGASAFHLILVKADRTEKAFLFLHNLAPSGNANAPTDMPFLAEELLDEIRPIPENDQVGILQVLQAEAQRAALNATEDENRRSHQGILRKLRWADEVKAEIPELRKVEQQRREVTRRDREPTRVDEADERNEGDSPQSVGDSEDAQQMKTRGPTIYPEIDKLIADWLKGHNGRLPSNDELCSEIDRTQKCRGKDVMDMMKANVPNKRKTWQAKIRNGTA